MAAAVALVEFQKLVAMDIAAAGVEHFHSNLAVVLVLDLADYCNQQLYLMAELAVGMLLYELMLQLSVVELMAAEIVVAAEYCAVVDIVRLHLHDNYLFPVSVRNYSDLDWDYHHNLEDMPLLVEDHTSGVAVTAEQENMELVELVVQLEEPVHVVLHLDKEQEVLVVGHVVQQHVEQVHGDLLDVVREHVALDHVKQEHVGLGHVGLGHVVQVHVDQVHGVRLHEVQVHREDRVHEELVHEVPVDVEQH